MVLIKYEKKGMAMFLSHLDVLRCVSRAVRRAEITVNYSEGFNPTMEIFFSPPIPIGVESEAEFLLIDTNLSASEVYGKLQPCVPGWFKILKVKTLAKKINIAALVHSARYEVEFEGIAGLSEKFSEFLNKKPIILQGKKDSAGNAKEIDVTDRILSVKKIRNEGKVSAFEIISKVGNENVKIEKLLRAFFSEQKILPFFSILKKELFVTRQLAGNTEVVSFDTIF